MYVFWGYARGVTKRLSQHADTPNVYISRYTVSLQQVSVTSTLTTPNKITLCIIYDSRACTKESGHVPQSFQLSDGCYDLDCPRKAFGYVRPVLSHIPPTQPLSRHTPQDSYTMQAKYQSQH